MTGTASVQTLAYATPIARPPRLAAAVWIAIIGLALIGLGGCFMIGIMMVIRPNAFTGTTTAALMTPCEATFLIALSVAAMGCFIGAVVLLLRGVKSLFGLIDK